MGGDKNKPVFERSINGKDTLLSKNSLPLVVEIDVGTITG
jgi:hypothetical protein